MFFVSLKSNFIGVYTVNPENYHKLLPFKRKFTKISFFKNERLSLRDNFYILNFNVDKLHKDK
ncbi:hypothetical protein ADICYQ_4139 [Cyclobacterium qasimii M12-11B]|uniref:Uncharacterized protein n=1 Tax=Cyclobacterium qasimii M12-11B TaxID=641524 RepID=S7WRZ8_9BACT|nr:hypothetical protein ADICYQ_4139 [Cyclobacterium qasimii M12-11B]